MEFNLKLSCTSKMPCHSYAIPASECVTGAKLRLVQGSVCAGCYAMKGRAMFGNVKNARQLQFDQLPAKYDHNAWNAWGDAMIELIKTKERSGFFRWFDSGDLQGYDMLHEIVRIAKALPHIKFWLPTHEKIVIALWYAHPADDIVEFPDNLIVRISGAMVNGSAPVSRTGLSSTVYDSQGEAYGHACLCGIDRKECGDCRACWNKAIPNISHKKH